MQFIQEQIEEDYFTNHPEWLAETDKAWDWIHRVHRGRINVAFLDGHVEDVALDRESLAGALLVER